MNKLRAVILDWAGTTVDFGCTGPLAVMRELFFENGVEVSEEEARRHMGLLKRDHIRAILDEPRVADAWAVRHGSRAAEADVERLAEQFTPRLIEHLGQSSNVIVGVPETIAAMRARGLRIGSTTGYTRAMLDPVMARAEAQGYRPDVSVTPDEAEAGRPAPWMCFRNMALLNVFPPAACVKIGDTPADMREGLNAGMWTVGIIDSGNEVGLPQAAWEALDENHKELLREAARTSLRDAGAHFVVNSMEQIGGVLDEIERRMR